MEVDAEVRGEGVVGVDAEEDVGGGCELIGHACELMGGFVGKRDGVDREEAFG